VGDIVLLEVLQGATSDAQGSYISGYLRAIGVTPMLDAAGAVRAAKNYRLLREKGVTIRKTADLIIGSFCLYHGRMLLHRDRDFDHMERHLGLQVVRA
jgi:predicted nucleic acid-binding protein